jgi:hypothetical protein
MQKAMEAQGTTNKYSFGFFRSTSLIVRHLNIYILIILNGANGFELLRFFLQSEEGKIWRYHRALHLLGRAFLEHA